MPGSVQRMENIQGWRVVTHEGKAVGHVDGESEAALVVECGTWPRKAWRALPKRYAVPTGERSVMMQVSKEMLALSPKLKHGEPVDDAIVQADHREYADLGPEDLPAQAIVDGRGVLDAERFAGRVKRLGRP